ncbi:hypothetical protein ACRZ5S_22300 (plasmid) [Vibrio scophthalmi]|uniref:hypothetical protein n=1 Tax=Vibrio scophthalmi TaxID=45658 RepID=UPI003EB8E1FF
MNNVYTQYHNQITQCFNAVDEESQDILDVLTTQTQAAMKEIILNHTQWLTDAIDLSQMAEHRDYLGHIYNEHDDFVEVLRSDNVDEIFNRVQFLPHLVYELVALGAPRPSNLGLVDVAIQKIVMKSMASFRRALLSTTFDPSRVEDKLQDASIELIRAARTYRNVGKASFITYAWRRVMVQVNRKLLHSQLVVKVSNRDVENAFRTVEINSDLTTQLSVANLLPNAVDIDDGESHNNIQLSSQHSFESEKFRRNIRAKLVSSLNNLKPNEKVVILGECGLLGNNTPATALAERLNLSRSSYSHSKINALKKLGFYKELDAKWAEMSNL